MTRCAWLAMLCASAVCSGVESGRLPVRITWGHTRPASSSYFIQVSADRGMSVGPIQPFQLELNETPATSHAGGGDIDGIEFTLDYPKQNEARLQKLQVIWADLLAAADADTARRLGNDAGMEPHAPRLFIRTNAEGSRGFAVTIEQLKREKAIWVPSYDVFLTAGEPLVDFASHMAAIRPWQGSKVLDRIAAKPEATYEQYTGRWEDMGSPLYVNPQQTGNGHIICLAWDSSLRKFGVDRGAGVRNDFGNPDRFRFWLEIGDLSKGVAQVWKSQHLLDGLPIVVTVFERDQIRYEIEQFAFPLDGPPSDRNGEIRMVLLERLRLSSLDGKPHRVPITMSHRRAMNAGLASAFEVTQEGARVQAKNSSFGQTLLQVDGASGEAVWSGIQDYDKEGMKRLNITIPADVPAQGTRDLIIKLPSPMVDSEGAATLASIDYDAARVAALRFWNSWLEKGAQFTVPEKVVNDLFRATLWHALRLPRRHGTSGDVRIDLPYSNFAYDQSGTPWPVNQAVYVDYMLYGLRGYDNVAQEELRAQYRNNQEVNGHVSGYANWVVYTPGMLYATAQNYLLSRDRAAFDRLLPQNLKALDWCLSQVHSAEAREGAARGLVSGPLNDLTGDGLWAFNQAYMYAALDLFGRALEQEGHPRGQEARKAAARLAESIDRGFHTASARSPLVQLRDHTWIPFVPSEAGTFQRSFSEWYPADVDTGPVHLVRLKAVPANSDLAGWLLNDHEDNLFLRGLGIANEPVYNQHATAYLMRDNPAAVIRTFYSYMASAFSHSALEPVEHRFTHGQYFGPPSTDGAWFELYRNMLVMERDDDSLLLAGFTPRTWLANDQQIQVLRAPTRFGPLSMTIHSRAASGRIEADVRMPERSRPAALLVRLRHPSNAPIRTVQVNGRPWTDFDPAKEWIRISAPGEKRYTIVAGY